MTEIKLLRKKNYLTMIQNAARGENNMFRNLYMTIDGIEQDALKNGELSCAAFVSSVLYILKLINDVRATVAGTEKNLLANGWHQVSEPQPGTILMWEAEKYEDGSSHEHIGFFIGNNRAVSNDSGKGIPQEHDWRFDGKRKVVRMYWHPSLDQ